MREKKSPKIVPLILFFSRCIEKKMQDSKISMWYLVFNTSIIAAFVETFLCSHSVASSNLHV